MRLPLGRCRACRRPLRSAQCALLPRYERPALAPPGRPARPARWSSTSASALREGAHAAVLLPKPEAQRLHVLRRDDEGVQRLGGQISGGTTPPYNGPVSASTYATLYAGTGIALGDYVCR